MQYVEIMSRACCIKQEAKMFGITKDNCGLRITNSHILRSTDNYKTMKSEFIENQDFRDTVKTVLDYAEESGKSFNYVGYLMQYSKEKIQLLINTNYVGLLPFGEQALFTASYHSAWGIPFTCIYVGDTASQFLMDVKSGRIA